MSKGQTTNTSLKKYAEPRNKTGKGGFGDRPQDRNNSGQRSREVVETAAQLRALYVKVLHEPINAPLNNEMSNMEFIARQHVKAAKQGIREERETMFDRIWGKSNQRVDLTSSDGSMTPQAVMFVPFVNNANDCTDTDSA